MSETTVKHENEMRLSEYAIYTGFAIAMGMTIGALITGLIRGDVAGWLDGAFRGDIVIAVWAAMFTLLEKLTL